MSVLTNKQKREWAQTLYVNQGMEQKQIALKVGVSEKTVGTWKKDYKWEGLKAAVLTTKSEQLKMFYAQLNALNIDITSRDVGKRYANNSESDTIVKLTKSIRNLENEAGVAEIISVCTQVLDFIGAADQELAQTLSAFIDDFIKSKLK